MYPCYHLRRQVPQFAAAVVAIQKLDPLRKDREILKEGQQVHLLKRLKALGVFLDQGHPLSNKLIHVILETLQQLHQLNPYRPPIGMRLQIFHPAEQNQDHGQTQYLATFLIDHIY